MPMRPPKLCSWPGCHLEARVGCHCAEHHTLAKRVQDHMLAAHQARTRTPGTTRERGYGSSWQKLRNAYIMDHPLCERCSRPEHPVLAVDVHHKTAVMAGGTNDWDNLEALCRSCHWKARK